MRNYSRKTRAVTYSRAGHGLVEVPSIRPKESTGGKQSDGREKGQDMDSLIHGQEESRDVGEKMRKIRDKRMRVIAKYVYLVTSSSVFMQVSMDVKPLKITVMSGLEHHCCLILFVFVCICVFLYFILHSCCIIVSTLGWTGWD